MSKRKTKPENPVTIQDLYPGLSPEQQQEAAYNLGRYLELVRRIFERPQNLTGQDKLSSMQMPDDS
jgi:hypothetical protein